MLVICSFISVPILQMRKLSFPEAWSQSHLHQDPLGVLVKNTDSQALPPSHIVLLSRSGWAQEPAFSWPLPSGSQAHSSLRNTGV